MSVGDVCLDALAVMVTLGVAIWCTTQRANVLAAWLLFAGTGLGAVLTLVALGVDKVLALGFLPYELQRGANFGVSVLQFGPMAAVGVGLWMFRRAEPTDA